MCQYRILLLHLLRDGGDDISRDDVRFHDDVHLRDGDDDHRDIGSPFRFDGFAQQRGIHISLEGRWNRWLFSFGAQTIDAFGAGKFDVGPGGIEERIADEIFPVSSKNGEDDLFGRTPLVRRNDVRHTGDAAYRFFEFEETAAARIGLIALHDAGPLMAAHGTRTAIGQQVDEYSG